MQDHRTRIVFDTSALNGLADEMNSFGIAQSLGIGFQVRLSETNLSELAATADQDRRAKLLGFCKHLMAAGECIRPYNWIIESQVKEHARSPLTFNWNRLQIRGRELEEALARNDFIGTDEAAKLIVDDFSARSAEFDAVYKDARPAFDKIFAQQDAERPPLTGLIEALKTKGSFWTLAAGMYKRACGSEIDEAGIKGFITACPPFHAVMISLTVAQFHHCIRDFRERAIYRAGRLDLFMAAYLPYCERFITRDPGQYNALNAVVSEAALSTEVWTFDQFRRNFLLAA